MQDFALYFALGREHILDWRGYDHILFVLALCGIYQWANWRRVLILVTAFTVGHSFTLALSLFNKLPISSAWIEFLIPLTILLMAISNLFSKHPKRLSGDWGTYVLVLFFGLIHGLGFSAYLKSLLGTDESIWTQLLAFNLGLEFGQILIVITILVFAQWMLNQFRIAHREWIIFLSAAIFALALQMSIERFLAI